MTGNSARELDWSRREILLGITAAGVASLLSAQRSANAAVVRTDDAKLPPYGNGTLPAGIRSRSVADINGLSVHYLESGFETPDRPVVLLLHGFPELAYSWRKVMVPLAATGYRVIAPDRRGYGRTTGWDDAYDVDLDAFNLFTMVRDSLALLSTLGYKSVSTVVGHDFGSLVAAWCAMIRPDVFHSVVLMSAPFAGAPMWPFDTTTQPQLTGASAPTLINIDVQLAALPRPRKYYMRYYSTREANHDMLDAPQGLQAFLRAYFHHKSADWKQNSPVPLKARTAEELAKLPTYYMMDLDQGMAETVRKEMPTPAEVAACKWLTDAELSVYATEYARTGFQGALQAYRCMLDPKQLGDLRLYSGRTIDVPSVFIAGKSDWGVYQTPGAFETMKNKTCTQMLDAHLIEGAGHWVQQEQPGLVNEILIQFLRRQARA